MFSTIITYLLTVKRYKKVNTTVCRTQWNWQTKEMHKRIQRMDFSCYYIYKTQLGHYKWIHPVPGSDYLRILSNLVHLMTGGYILVWKRFPPPPKWCFLFLPSCGFLTPIVSFMSLFFSILYLFCGTFLLPIFLPFYFAFSPFSLSPFLNFFSQMT